MKLRPFRLFFLMGIVFGFVIPHEDWEYIHQNHNYKSEIHVTAVTYAPCPHVIAIERECYLTYLVAERPPTPTYLTDPGQSCCDLALPQSDFQTALLVNSCPSGYILEARFFTNGTLRGFICVTDCLNGYLYNNICYCMGKRTYSNPSRRRLCLGQSCFWGTYKCVNGMICDFDTPSGTWDPCVRGEYAARRLSYGEWTYRGFDDITENVAYQINAQAQNYLYAIKASHATCGSYQHAHTILSSSKFAYNNEKDDERKRYKHNPEGLIVHYCHSFILPEPYIFESTENCCEAHALEKHVFDVLQREQFCPCIGGEQWIVCNCPLGYMEEKFVYKSSICMRDCLNGDVEVDQMGQPKSHTCTCENKTKPYITDTGRRLCLGRQCRSGKICPFNQVCTLSNKCIDDNDGLYARTTTPATTTAAGGSVSSFSTVAVAYPESTINNNRNKIVIKGIDMTKCISPLRYDEGGPAVPNVNSDFELIDSDYHQLCGNTTHYWIGNYSSLATSCIKLGLNNTKANSYSMVLCVDKKVNQLSLKLYNRVKYNIYDNCIDLLHPNSNFDFRHTMKPTITQQRPLHSINFSPNTHVCLKRGCVYEMGGEVSDICIKIINVERVRVGESVERQLLLCLDNNYERLFTTKSPITAYSIGWYGHEKGFEPPIGKTCVSIFNQSYISSTLSLSLSSSAITTPPPHSGLTLTMLTNQIIFGFVLTLSPITFAAFV
jgi:hypothetical protein